MPLNTVIPDKCLVEKLDDPHHMQNYVSQILTMPKVATKGNVEEVFRDTDSVSLKSNISAQLSDTSNENKPSNGSMCKGDSDYHARKASQACIEYRRKMHKTLSMLNDNMSNMLKESFTGIDSICHRVRNCIYELEHQNALLRARMYSNILHEEAERDFESSNTTVNENEAKCDMSDGEKDMISGTKKEKLREIIQNRNQGKFTEQNMVDFDKDEDVVSDGDRPKDFSRNEKVVSKSKEHEENQKQGKENTCISTPSFGDRQDSEEEIREIDFDDQPSKEGKSQNSINQPRFLELGNDRIVSLTAPTKDDQMTILQELTKNGKEASESEKLLLANLKELRENISKIKTLNGLQKMRSTFNSLEETARRIQAQRSIAKDLENQSVKDSEVTKESFSSETTDQSSSEASETPTEEQSMSERTPDSSMNSALKDGSGEDTRKRDMNEMKPQIEGQILEDNLSACNNDENNSSKNSSAAGKSNTNNDQVFHTEEIGADFVISEKPLKKSTSSIEMERERPVSNTDLNPTETSGYETPLKTSESDINVDQVYNCIFEISKDIAKNVKCANYKNKDAKAKNRECLQSFENEFSNDDSAMETDETDLQKELSQNLEKIKLKNKETFKKQTDASEETQSNENKEKPKGRRNVKISAKVSKIKSSSKTDLASKKKKNINRARNKSLKNDSSSYSDFLSNDSESSDSWENVETISKGSNKENRLPVSGKHKQNNLDNNFANRYEYSRGYCDETTDKDIREIAHMLEKIDEEMFFSSNSNCSLTPSGVSDLNAFKQNFVDLKKVKKLKKNAKKKTDKTIEEESSSEDVEEVEKIPDLAKKEEDKALETKKIEFLKLEPVSRSTVNECSIRDVYKGYHEEDGTKNGIAIFQDFALGPIEEAKIQCVMQFSLNKLTDKIYYVEDYSDNEEAVEISLEDKLLLPPDVYRKRAFVDLHQKLIQQIDASDSLLGFIRLIERKKYFMDNDEEDDTLKTVALKFANLGNEKSKENLVKITEVPDNGDTEAVTKQEEKRRKKTKGSKNKSKKHAGKKESLRNVKSSISYATKIHQKSVVRADDLAKKYVDSLYFSPAYIRKRRISRVMSPKKAISKELKMSEAALGPRRPPREATTRSAGRPDSAKSARPVKGAKSDESCSSRCTCRMLIQNARPSITSTSAKCKIHWMRAKIQQTAKNRRKYLNFCDILDDVTLKDLTPFQSEYPRRDCLVPMGDDSLRKVQDTYLYSLLYGKNGTKNAWDNLLTSASNSLEGIKGKDKLKQGNSKKKKSNNMSSTNTSKSSSVQKTSIQPGLQNVSNEVAKNSLVTHASTPRQNENDDWVIEKLTPYMRDPQPQYYRAMTILPVKVFYDNFPSLRGVQNLEELYSQDLENDSDHEAIDMDVGSSTRPISAREYVRRGIEDVSSDSKSATPVTPLPPRVIITDPSARRETRRAPSEERTLKRNSGISSKGDSPKSSKLNSPRRSPQVTQLNLQQKKKTTPLTESERQLWSNKFGKTTGQKLVSLVARQSEKAAQSLVEQMTANRMGNLNRQPYNFGRKTLKDGPKKIAEMKAKSGDRSNLAVTAKKSAPSSTSSVQAKRQRMMLNQLHSLKARNTLIQDNIQKAIEVIETKMVDLLSSANDTNSIEAFNIMEKEITGVLNMMKSDKSDESEKDANAMELQQNHDQMVPEKESAGISTVDPNLPKTPSTTMVREFQCDSPSARRLFQKLNHILLSEGSAVESDSRPDSKAKTPPSRKKLRSKTNTQLPERKKRKSLSSQGTEVLLGRFEDTSTSAEEKFIITVSREPPRRKAKRPKSRESKTSSVPQVPTSSIPASEETSPRDRPASAKASPRDRPASAKAARPKNTDSKQKDLIEMTPKPKEFVETVPADVVIKKETIKKEIISSVVDNLQKIKQKIDSDPEMSTVSEEFAVASAKGSCGDGMTAFEHEVDEVIAKVDDICTKLAHDELGASATPDTQEPSNTFAHDVLATPNTSDVQEPSTSKLPYSPIQNQEVTNVESDPFLTPFMSALKTLRKKSPDRKSPKPSSTKNAVDPANPDISSSEVEMNPSYYSIINFLDTLSSMDEERAVEVHTARGASTVLVEETAEVVYPADVVQEVTLTPVVLAVDEKGDCKLAAAVGDGNATASGDHPGTNNEAAPESSANNNIIQEPIPNITLPLPLSAMEDKVPPPTDKPERESRPNEIKGNYGHQVTFKEHLEDSRKAARSNVRLNKKLSFCERESTEDVFKPIKDVMRLFANDELSCTSFIEKYYQMEGRSTANDAKSLDGASTSLKNDPAISGGDLGAKPLGSGKCPTSDSERRIKAEIEQVMGSQILSRTSEAVSEVKQNDSSCDRNTRKRKHSLNKMVDDDPNLPESRDHNFDIYMCHSVNREDDGEKIPVCSCTKCKNINLKNEDLDRTVEGYQRRRSVDDRSEKLRSSVASSRNQSKECSRMNSEISSRSVYGKSESNINATKFSENMKHQIPVKIGCVKSEIDSQDRRLYAHKRSNVQRNNSERENDNNRNKRVENIYTNKKCKDSEDDLDKVEEIIDGIIVNIRKSTKKDYLTEYHHGKLLKSFYTALFTIMFIALVFDYSC